MLKKSYRGIPENAKKMLKFIFKAVKFLKIQKFLFFILKTYGKFFPNNKVSRGGIKYELDLTKLIDISIFFGGWEKTTIQFLKANVKENDIVIEGRANIGAHTLLIGSLVGNGGSVVAVEPTEFALKKLRKNIDLNPHIKSIDVVDSIASDAEILIIDNLNSDWSLDSTQSPQPLKSKATTVDLLVEKFKFTKVDLLKIDVDGYDFKVLKGSKDTIEKFKPTIFIELCEYTLRGKGDSVKDIFKFLFELGYECFDEITDQKLKLMRLWLKLA